MGINDEYSRDAYVYEQVWDSDDEAEVPDDLHPADWQDLYSQELLNGWMVIRSYLDTNYIESSATYPKFVDLVMDPSKWYSSQKATRVQEKLWSEICPIKVISERVGIENFITWSNNFEIV
jgi:hypothetical protein